MTRIKGRANRRFAPWVGVGFSGLMHFVLLLSAEVLNGLLTLSAAVGTLGG